MKNIYLPLTSKNFLKLIPSKTQKQHYHDMNLLNNGEIKLSDNKKKNEIEESRKRLNKYINLLKKT